MLENKQVLYLVPEIALTSQIVRRLQSHFGGYLGIYHSRFSQNERFEIWNKVRKGEVKILLGARSALFLPFTDLSLVIVDEEHDSSYKQQDPAPRYHARDTAIYYASLFKAKTLLGSATPSIESYYNAVTGKYGLAELLERYRAGGHARYTAYRHKEIFPEGRIQSDLYARLCRRPYRILWIIKNR